MTTDTPGTSDTSSAITVRQANLADRPRIAEFLPIAYPGRAQYKYPERWQWQFIDNPFVHGFEGIPIWIALAEDRIIGQTCAQLEPFKVGDQQTTVGWSVDTFVCPEYRGYGIGKQLQKANQDAHRLFMSLSMSAANRGIKKKLGATQLPVVKVLDLRIGIDREQVERRLRRSSSLLGIAARACAVDRLAASLLSARRRLEWKQAQRDWQEFVVNLSVEEVPQFDERLDQFWQRRRTDFGIAVERTSDYLNWKYVAQPHSRHHRFVATMGDNLCGYFVLRETAPPEPPMVLILDVLGETRQLTAQLIVKAVEQSLALGHVLIRAATSDRVFLDQYHRIGFTDRRELTPMWFSSEFVPPAPANPLMSYGDHDLDQYPLAKL